MLPVWPKPVQMDGKIFNPSEHFRDWRGRQEAWRKGKSSRLATALKTVEKLREKELSHAEVAKALNAGHLERHGQAMDRRDGAKASLGSNQIGFGQSSFDICAPSSLKCSGATTLSRMQSLKFGMKLHQPRIRTTSHKIYCLNMLTGLQKGFELPFGELLSLQRV